MKQILYLIPLLFVIPVLTFAQDIAPAPPGKAVVYFTRTSSYGFAINFSYFDSTKLIGKFCGQGYIRYECEPGAHLFWARSENKDFVEAELDTGKIYIIESLVQMGFIKAGVELLPIDPGNQKKMKGILKLLNKQPAETMTEQELKAGTESFQQVISRALTSYRNDKESGNSITRLEKTMFYK